MKNLIIIFSLLLLPLSGFSQGHFELVKSSATEEHPGIPQSPVTYTVTYYFISQEDNVTVQAMLNDGIEDAIIDSRVLNKGDRLSLQYINRSYYSYDPPVDPISEDPYFAESDKDMTVLIFLDYNLDRMKTTTSFPVYYVNGEKFEFELPSVKDEDIQRIYYP